jgi:hypothetical protein
LPDRASATEHALLFCADGRRTLRTVAKYDDIIVAVRENFVMGGEVRVSAVSKLVPGYSAEEVKAMLDAALVSGDLVLAGHFDVRDDEGEPLGESVPVYKLPT